MQSVLHVDLNSFYANCEIIASGGKYTYDSKLIVTGNPDARCGIILAASYPAKKYGVKAGMTMADARNLCPGAVFVRARFPLYFRKSKDFMAILRDYSPMIESGGMDEAYLDYTGCEGLLGPAVETAHAIRNRVKRETGLTVSVGVSYNKLLAKMGSDYKKPDEVTVITPDNFQELIWPLPVNNLISVGRQNADKLAAMSIRTIGDLANTPVKILKERFGVNGVVMYMYANGIDNSQVRNKPDPVKGIGNGSTLPNDAQTLDEIKVMLLVHCEQVAKRLREINKACRVVQIGFRDTRLKTKQHQMTLPVPTDLTEDIYYAAAKLAFELWNGEKVRQIRIRVTRLTEADDYEQLSFFPEEKRIKKRHLDQCIDQLRKQYGNNSVCRGSVIAEGLEHGIWYEDVPFSFPQV